MEDFYDMFVREVLQECQARLETEIAKTGDGGTALMRAGQMERPGLMHPVLRASTAEAIKYGSTPEGVANRQREANIRMWFRR